MNNKQLVNGYYSDNEYLLVDRENDFITIDLSTFKTIETLNKSDPIPINTRFYDLINLLMETKPENLQKIINYL